MKQYPIKHHQLQVNIQKMYEMYQIYFYVKINCQHNYIIKLLICI